MAKLTKDEWLDLVVELRERAIPKGARKQQVLDATRYAAERNHPATDVLFDVLVRWEASGGAWTYGLLLAREETERSANKPFAPDAFVVDANNPPTRQRQPPRGSRYGQGKSYTPRCARCGDTNKALKNGLCGSCSAIELGTPTATARAPRSPVDSMFVREVDQCVSCAGHGTTAWNTKAPCAVCDGSGVIPSVRDRACYKHYPPTQRISPICPVCGGDGRSGQRDQCQTCDGLGRPLPF